MASRPMFGMTKSSEDLVIDKPEGGNRTDADCDDHNSQRDRNAEEDAFETIELVAGAHGMLFNTKLRGRDSTCGDQNHASKRF